MLTSEQLKQLEPLTKHPKFGHILAGAIRSWNKYEPKPDNYGIKFSSDLTSDNQKKIIVRKDDTKGCCLLGAFFLRKKASNWKELEGKLKISYAENTSLYRGFDGKLKEDYFDQEAYEFGLKVREIVLC